MVEIVLIFILLLLVFVGWIGGKHSNENAWLSDCAKLGAHVTEQGKVVKCEAPK